MFIQFFLIQILEDVWKEPTWWKGWRLKSTQADHDLFLWERFRWQYQTSLRLLKLYRNVLCPIIMNLWMSEDPNIWIQCSVFIYTYKFKYIYQYNMKIYVWDSNGIYLLLRIASAEDFILKLLFQDNFRCKSKIWPKLHHFRKLFSFISRNLSTSPSFASL